MADTDNRDETLPVWATGPSTPNADPGSPAAAPDPHTVEDARSIAADWFTVLTEAVALPDQADRDLAVAYQRAIDRLVANTLAAVDLDVINNRAHRSIRPDLLRQAGIHTAADVLARAQHLTDIRGIGPTTAATAVVATQVIERDVRDGTRVQFDLDRRDRAIQPVLAMILRANRLDNDLRPSLDRLTRLGAQLASLVDRTEQHAAGRVRRLFMGRARRDDIEQAARELVALINEPDARRLVNVAEAAVRATEPADPWTEFERDPIQVNITLEQVARAAGTPTRADTTAGPLVPDLADLSHALTDGPVDLGPVLPPAEVAATVEQATLDTSLLICRLRGYQAFAARFVLTQDKVVIGDEMGLGKTIEALAVAAHMHAHGQTHTLVVCPSSVLSNWEHETEKHTHLTPIRLHGADRDRAHRRWMANGGVALTTYDTLWRLDVTSPAATLVIIDETHLIKNPSTKRTKECARWIEAADRAILMSGTPMENRIEEFAVVLGHVRRGLKARILQLAARGNMVNLRDAIADVYLRRRQDDVLNEIPERIETIEYVDLTTEDAAVYRRLVVEGAHFQTVRQAAFQAEDSAKVARLWELVDEATERGRKVVVFSYFHHVLNRAAEAVGDLHVGTITGAVSPDDRLRLVQEFTDRKGGAVLVAQIEAGGVGLNIQAGSVVILCEPQWKPSTEEQAIARCQRMGQVRRVEVHRLIAEDTIDLPMLNLLASKREAFDLAANPSSLKKASEKAVCTLTVGDATIEVDTRSEGAAAERILAAERDRLTAA